MLQTLLNVIHVVVCIFLILVATIYAGELVWRERDVRTDAMRDVLPASSGAIVAGKVLGPYSSTEQRELWLEEKGYNRPFLLRYVEWVGNALRGDFGDSIRFKTPVSNLLWDRLGNTGILALCVFAIMIPLSLALGVQASTAL